MATFSSSWGSAEPVTALEAQSASSVVHGLTLSQLPLVLTRPAPVDTEQQQQQQVPCELALAWSAAEPLRCRQLKLEIVCSARHVELFIEGVRRSLLGEDEQGEVYLGTFRGAKQSQATGGATGGAGNQQFFAISEEFLQRESKTNILKETQKLRVKFVSLTGDKSVLHIQELKCAYVPLQLYDHPPPSAQAAAPLAPTAPFQVPGGSEPTGSSSQPQAPPMVASVAASQLAGLSLNGGGIPAAAFGGMDTQALMKGFQQMLEREMETKIMKAVDAKLEQLSQRLVFTEQKLVQLHQQVDANGSDVQATLVQIKQQFAQLESQVKRQHSQLPQNEDSSPQPSDQEEE